MKLEINAEELSLLLDLLANAGANNQLLSGLLSFFWRVTSAWHVTSAWNQVCSLVSNLAL